MTSVRLNQKARRQAPGFMLTELIVAMGVITILLFCAGASLQSLRQFTHTQWTRQHCLAAAQAQLDCLASQGRELTKAELARLWPRVTLTTTRRNGQGQWQGLERFAVTAEMPAGAHTVRVRLSRYRVLPADAAQTASQASPQTE